MRKPIALSDDLQESRSSFSHLHSSQGLDRFDPEVNVPEC